MVDELHFYLLNGKLENTFEEYSISPYTYTIYKFNHGNQKFAKIHGTWTGILGGNLFNGFYQSSITNLGVFNSKLGLQIKRIITQSFYFTSSEGALIFVGLTNLNIEANSINGTIQFLKSQQRNNCRLEWDIEVELLYHNYYVISKKFNSENHCIKIIFLYIRY